MEKIRAYHKKFYRPENLYLTITGNIQPEQVFDAIEKVSSIFLWKNTNTKKIEMNAKRILFYYQHVPTFFPFVIFEVFLFTF